MSWRKTIFMIGGLAIMLGIAGCKRTPLNIAKWKEAGNTGKLISATGDSQQIVRIKAIEALVDLKCKEAIEPLAALFSDPDPFIAHKAIEAVASMEVPAIEKHMLRALGFKTAEARTPAATALGTLKSKAAVEPLIAALNDKHDSVVVAAATALGQIGNPEAVDPLAKKVDDRSFSIRMASVTSLGQLGGTEAAKGLEPAMGDYSDKVRSAAVEALIGIGPLSAPLALDALRSANHFTRESGIEVLQGLNDVPTTGSDGVWYRLASLTAGVNPVVDPAKDTGLASIDNLEALLEALVHEQREVRDYALLALAAIGEPAAAPVVAFAEENADLEAKMWLNGRVGWSGAPAWQIDLWAAATALDPGFMINERIISDLIPHRHSAEQMMNSEEFIPSREYIPLLIAQFATHGTDFATGESKPTFFGLELKAEKSQDEIDRKRTRHCRRLAAKQLIKADYQAALPLLAALNDDDLETVAHSARTLFKICPELAEEPVLASFSKRLDNGEELSGTTFQKVMQELTTPAVEALLLKVRPNVAQAIRTAQRKYPDVEFSNIPMEVAVDPNLKAAPFRLAHFEGARKKELRIVFRPDENGDWIPNPPLADKLP